jgi:uncharacterized protein YggE
MATITVRGRGVTTVAPDEVTVGLTVEALRKSAGEAFAEATRLAQQVVALCDELGIDAGRRTTSRVTLAEDGEHTSKGWQHRGYRASSRLAVRLDDGELASRLVTEAAERVELRIDGPGWRVAHDNPGHADARRLAAADARQKAEEYAGALGGRIGAIASVDEPETKPAAVSAGPTMLRAAADMPVEGGEHEMVAEIDVTFQLEQG